jgi:hypothetical protein
MALQAEDVPIAIALASAEIPAPERHESRRVGFIDIQGFMVYPVLPPLPGAFVRNLNLGESPGCFHGPSGRGCAHRGCLSLGSHPRPERHECRLVGFIDTQSLSVYLVVLFYGRCPVAPCWGNARTADLEVLKDSAA